MTALIQDRYFASRVIGERKASGNDRWDEVWDGVYIFMPNPNIEHQDLATGLSTVLRVVIDWPGLGKVYQGINVSDRDDDWTRNYRCPDVAVYLKENPAVARQAYWFGGPDFAVEIVSPNDRSREKFDFYAKTKVRELLLIDREPWSLELYRRQGEDWTLAGKSGPDQGEILASTVLPLRFRLIAGDTRPAIEVSLQDGTQSWTV